MIDFRTKLHMPNSSGSSVITIKLEAEDNISHGVPIDKILKGSDDGV
jgi:hypothetical protein